MGKRFKYVIIKLIIYLSLFLYITKTLQNDYIFVILNKTKSINAIIFMRIYNQEIIWKKNK